MQWLYLIAAAFLVSASTIDVANIPQCARTCLTNSTASASSCTSIDVKCLCSDNAFVSSLSCCLATQCTIPEQAIAIQFNQEQCAAVNASAPNFVGCSPLGLTTSVISGNNTVTTFTTASTDKGAASTYSNRLTIATIETLPASYTNPKISTATFAGQPLYTGSCSVPFFALAGSPSSMTLFPEIGCAPDRADCCAIDINANAGVTRCPQDYFTTASGCCPNGYQVYYTAIGLETPCYSVPSTALVPASSPTLSGLTVITDQVFSKKYVLVASTSGPVLPPGSIAGITINAVLFIAVIVAIVWCVKRRKRKAAERELLAVSTFPPEEPVLPPANEVTSPQELASPEMVVAKSPQQQQWPFTGSSPPAYEGEKPRPVPTKVIPPQELPGSTYINEHHPVFTESEADTDMTPVTPATPTRSVVTSAAVSPAVSPTPMPHDDRTPTLDGWVSPLSSPASKK